MALRHRFDIIEPYGCRPRRPCPSVFVIMLIFVPSSSAPAASSPPSPSDTFWPVASPSSRNSSARPRTSPPPGTSHDGSPHLHLVAPDGLGFGDPAYNLNLVFTLRYTTLRPYTSWANVHSGFSGVAQFPTTFIAAEVEGMYHSACLFALLPGFLIPYSILAGTPGCTYTPRARPTAPFSRSVPAFSEESPGKATRVRAFAAALCHLFAICFDAIYL
ncbi:hypothetical protein C8R45DRAFT_1099360 [Mycena sanguinolenta]|nr:hypothetical protein C8R45DRAFT_1099360 [Mycena sanguinolenta]